MQYHITTKKGSSRHVFVRDDADLYFFIRALERYEIDSFTVKLR